MPIQFGQTEKPEERKKPVLQIPAYQRPEVVKALKEKQDLELATRVSKGDLGFSLAVTKGLDPVVGAKINKISRDTGLTNDTIRRNFTTYEEKQKAAEIFRLLETRRPDGKLAYEYTAAWLSNPKRMAESSDDVEALAEIEAYILSQSGSFTRQALYTLENESRRALRALAITGGELDLLTRPPTIEVDTGERLRLPLPQTEIRYTDEYIDRWSNFTGRETRQVSKEEQRKEIWSKLDSLPILDVEPDLDVEGARGFALGTIGIVPQVAGALIATLITGGSPVGAMAFMGSHIFGSSFEQHKSAGVPDDRAAQAAMLNAALQAPLEAIGLGKLFKFLKTKGGKRFFVELFKVAGTEFITETLQAYPEKATELWARDQDVESFAESVWQERAEIFSGETTLQGMQEGAMAATLAGFMGGANIVQHSNQLRKDLKNWEGLAKRVQEWNTVKRDPDTAAEYLQGLLEDNQAPTHVEIAYEAFEGLYQDPSIDNSDVDAILENLDVTDEQISEAKATGKELRVEVGKWHSGPAGRDIGLRLNQDVRFQEGQPTMREVEEAKTQIPLALEELTAEYEEIMDALKKEKLPSELEALKTQLTASRRKGGFGLTSNEADAMLSVLVAGASQLGKETGETIEQWFERVDPQLRIGGKAEQIAPAQPRRGAIQFQKARTVIRLFESADRSTFLHETSHLFIREMGSIIKAGLGSEQFQADYQTLLDFAGGKFNQAGEERVARAFEAYLREGKAPTLKLTKAFRQFRKWLTTIYKSLRDLNVEMSDDVNAVFDRILASQTEIDDAHTFYSMKRSFLDYLPDTPKKIVDKIRKQEELSEEEALEKQVSQHLDAYFRAEGGRAKLREDATNQINNLPVYQALNTITEAGGLPLQEMTDRFGEDMVKQIQGVLKAAIQKGGKARLSEIATQYEYTSEEAFIEDLIAYGPRGKAITEKSKELEAILRDQFREELTTEAFPGEEAVHSDARLKVLIAYAELMEQKLAKAEKRRARTINQAAIKQAAQDALSSLPVGKAIRYHDYSRTEQKWANKALQAARKSDWEAAFEAQRKQIFNHALVLEAINIRKEMTKIENRYKAKRLKSRLANVELNFRDAISDIVNAFQLSTGKDPLPVHTKEDPVAALKSIDETLYHQIPLDVAARRRPPDFARWQDLTVEQMRDIDSALRMIESYGKDILLSMKDDKAKTRQSFIDESTGHMNELPDKYVVEEKSPKIKELKENLDGLMAWGTVMDFIFKHMDNFIDERSNVFGPLRRLYRRGVKAETDFQSMRFDIHEEARPHWETLFVARQRIEKEQSGKFFDLPGISVTEDMIRTGQTKWTFEKMVSVLFNSGTENNKLALRNGHGFTDEHIQAIAQHFTREELSAVRGIWRATGTPFIQVDQTHFNLYNNHLVEEEAVPLTVTAKDGEITLEGGYYPLLFDHRMSLKAAEHKAQREASAESVQLNRDNAVFRKVKPNDSMTYSRTPGHSLPPLLNLSVWFSHVNDVARYVSHAEYLRDLNLITTNEEWANTFVAKAGRPMYKQLRLWASYQAQPQRQIADGFFGRHLEKQRAAATTALLSLKLGVGLKQRLSLLLGVNKIGWSYTWKAARQMGTHGVFGTRAHEQWQRILDISPYMKVRARAFDRDVYDALDRMKPTISQFDLYGKRFTIKDVQDWMFEWIQINDRATVGVIWQGAFMKALDQGKTEAEAVESADATISDTQPSALPLDLSGMQRAEGVGRLFTLFMTFQVKFANVYRSDFNAMKAGAITQREYARRVLYGVLGQSWGALMVGSLVQGELPEFWEILTAPLLSLLGWIPLARDFEGAILYDKSIGDSVVFEGYNRSKSVVESAWGVAQGNDEWGKLAWDAARVVEWQTKTPALNVVKDITRFTENIEE